MKHTPGQDHRSILVMKGRRDKGNFLAVLMVRGRRNRVSHHLCLRPILDLHMSYSRHLFVGLPSKFGSAYYVRRRILSLLNHVRLLNEFDVRRFRRTRRVGTLISSFSPGHLVIVSTQSSALLYSLGFCNIIWICYNDFRTFSGGLRR